MALHVYLLAKFTTWYCFCIKVYTYNGLDTLCIEFYKYVIYFCSLATLNNQLYFEYHSLMVFQNHDLEIENQLSNWVKLLNICFYVRFYTVEIMSDLC